MAKRSLIDSAIADLDVVIDRLPPRVRDAVRRVDLIGSLIDQARAVGGRPDERWIAARAADLRSEGDSRGVEVVRIDTGRIYRDVRAASEARRRKREANPRTRSHYPVVDMTGRA